MDDLLPLLGSCLALMSEYIKQTMVMQITATLMLDRVVHTHLQKLRNSGPNRRLVSSHLYSVSTAKRLATLFISVAYDLSMNLQAKVLAPEFDEYVCCAPRPLFSSTNGLFLGNGYCSKS